MSRQRLALLALAIFSGCSESTPIEKLPTASESLAQVSLRLGESLSIKDLTRFDRRGDLVAHALTSRERFELGHNLIRFQVDRPVLVTLAVLQDFEPFWLADQGFKPTGETLRNRDGDFSLHHKRFATGWVGLGVNSLDRRPKGHYAIFLQDADGRAIEPIATIPQGLKSRIADAKDGPYHDHVAPFESLSPSLVHATILPVSRDSRHTSAIIKDRVWKTHEPSTDRPDQVVVSTGASAATSLAWNWRTRPRVAKGFLRLAPLQFGSNEPDGSRSRIVAASSTLIESFGLMNDPVIRRHRVELADLQPDSSYAYSVGDGTVTGWTPWKAARTGPKPDRPYRLMYLGDAQCGLEGWGRMLAAAIQRHPDVSAILMAGDLVDRGNERSNWDHFFLRSSRVFDHVPLLPAVGNHEYLDRGPEHFKASFTLPDNGPAGFDKGLVYAVEIGDTFIAVLDSNLAKYDVARAAQQASWLEERASRSRARWRLAMFHHPIYASHPTRENPEIGRAWIDVFDRQGFDLVLQGHDHAYLRTDPMRQGRKAGSHERGTVYLVAVSGDKYCDQDPRDYTAKGFTYVSTYQLLDFDPSSETLLYRAFDATGGEVDRLSLSKKSAQPRIANQKSDRPH